MIPLGIEAGIVRKHGLEVDITWTAGGAETLQAVITDYALTNGVEGVLAAYAKGAPVRIVSSEMRGAGDIYWYVKADSPIKSLKDAESKTMTFSRPGSSSHLTAQQLAAKVGVAPKFVSTGAMPATRTQLVSGQIDIAWAAVPFALDAIKKGEFRIVARGGDLAELNHVSIRVNVTTAAFLNERPKAAQAFARAYKESIDWMYANLDKSAAYWAELTKISPRDREGRDRVPPEGTPRALACLRARPLDRRGGEIEAAREAADAGADQGTRRRDQVACRAARSRRSLLSPPSGASQLWLRPA